MNPTYADLATFPGGDIMARGLADLAVGKLSEDALAVLVASPRLTFLGVDIPTVTNAPTACEHALYEAIEERMPTGAHAAYKTVIDRIDSFLHAYTLAAKRTKPGNDELP
jgi:hypothetical protein